MLSYYVCQSDWLWSKYILFYIGNRQEIITDYTTEYVIQDIVRYMNHGHGILALNEAREVVAITAGYMGLPKNQHKDKHIAVLHNSYVLPRYQNSRTFLRGLQMNVGEIGKASPQVTEVRIHAAVNKPYLNRIYSKIARKADSPEYPNAQFDEYIVSYEALTAYCQRFSQEENVE